MLALLAVILAVIATATTIPQPPPADFTAGMLSGTVVTEPGTFVGLTWPCGDERCYAGLTWQDGAPMLDTGP